MHSEKCAQVVPAGESFRQEGFPLLLLLDVVDNFVGVGHSHLGHVAIQLSEVPSQF
jgi:hypothetical protein